MWLNAPGSALTEISILYTDGKTHGHTETQVNSSIPLKHLFCGGIINKHKREHLPRLRQLKCSIKTHTLFVEAIFSGVLSSGSQTRHEPACQYLDPPHIASVLQQLPFSSHSHPQGFRSSAKNADINSQYVEWMKGGNSPTPEDRAPYHIANTWTVGSRHFAETF